MSEGDVSMIQDEDVLRRMWQQTEDFSRKKEIRSQMYRLRDERLRNLYSPEPTFEKGCEFSSPQGHVKSFADQTYQTMKSKEVRDAGSPPKEFTYHGQELKDLSNAGWNVESENRTTDDGHTHVKSVHANIEGKYDVEGGHGQFAAVDSHHQATTEYQDDNTSLKRNESSSNTAAHEQVVRKTNDGTHFSSSTNSSSSTSKFEQTSTKHESVPHFIQDANIAEEVRSQSKYEQNLRSSKVEGELVSRKVEYPDDNTKVVVETRSMPDGTRVTSTYREFKVPSVQSSHSEQYSQQSKSESKFSSTEKRSEVKESAKTVHESTDDHHTTRQTQKNVDDIDLSSHKTDNKTEESQYSTKNIDNHQHYEKKTIDERQSESVEKDLHLNDAKNTRNTMESVDESNNTVYENMERKNISNQYETTYQSDFSQKKISKEMSPTHQAWASTLRADTPTVGRPSTRAASPGSRTFMSSTSTIRSSVSPDKTFRKPSSRGGSPSKIDRQSPSRSTDRYASNHSMSSTETKTTRYSTDRSENSPDRKPQDFRHKSTPSSESRPGEYSFRPSVSPDRKPPKPRDNTRAGQSPQRSAPTRLCESPDRKPGYMRPTIASQPRGSEASRTSPTRPNASLDRMPPKAPSQSPERKHVNTRMSKTQEDHYKFIDEETKMYTRSDINVDQNTRYSTSPDKIPRDSSSPIRKSPAKEQSVQDGSTPLAPSLKHARSPSPPKGLVTFTDEVDKRSETNEKTVKTESNIKDIKTRYEDYKKRTESPSKVRESSPSKYATYDKNTRRSEEIQQHTSTSKDTKYDTLTRTDKTTINKDITTSRSRVSPAKDKFKHATDFICTEKTNEETNKQAKGHPRQLLTPSTSPSRQPKQPETVTSTGQSSPTSSVSEFVYYSSPPRTSTIVTDLDDEEYFTETNVSEEINTYKRPETLNIKRSPSPTKIPCRSPSPPKSTPKETLPRKSSLKKKPSNDSILSPTEKPPTSFLVSPTEEAKDLPKHNIIKKDRPEKGDEPKVKPPFERRETYEERCRKILGMMEDDSITKKETITKSVTNRVSPPRFVALESNKSPSISPCASPKDDVSFSEITNTIRSAATDVSDFISKEKEDNIKITTINKPKTPSRETSPAKYQSKNSHQISVTTKSDKSNTVTAKNQSVSQSSQRDKSPAKPIASKARSPSPLKISTKVIESSDFLTTEREQEVLNKVNNSLRKLSPNRDAPSPTRERSPNKTTTSLQDLDIVNTLETSFDKTTGSVTSKATTKKSSITEKVATKPSSRTTSPTKKPAALPKTEKTTNFSSKPRSISPQKPISSTERPASPQVSKTSFKPREPAPSNLRKPSSVPTSPTRPEKPITSPSDAKKLPVTKQNSFSQISSSKTGVINKFSPTVNKTKTIGPQEPKRDTPKGNKENVTPKKEDVKVTRTTSDASIKAKKPSPQRMRSKPEIHVNDLSSKTAKQTTIKTEVKTPKFTLREPQKFAAKPKSATSLNTQRDENEILVDVEQAKSSRENSPDRICPTPINFLEDIGTPRYPDEVNEPDDEFVKRTNHTIHETESIVDDIVEISEDEELFTKKTDVHRVTDSDECLLSVNDKVSKFTSTIENITKPKESTERFKDTEKLVHSDFIDDNIKSDECLLSVSEKVTKFANGPQEVKDTTATSRSKITEGYDTETVYQDDYTKKSVNDKAHYFFETAENVTVPKVKPAQKVERPDLSKVDESLKSDDCLLSVSDKVNKFVKTAEKFLNESQEVENKERKIREQHEKIMNVVKNIESFDETDQKVETEVIKTKTHEHKQEKLGSFAKETASSQAKNKDYSSPNLKPVDTPIVKITTLRSSEAVKKAKAMFENIASTTQKNKDSKTTKLTDIGVIKKSPITDSTTVLHPSIEDFTRPDIDSDTDIPTMTNGKDRPSSGTFTRPHDRLHDDRPRSSCTRATTQSPEVTPLKSPARVTEIVTKTILSRYPIGQKADSPKIIQSELKTPEKVDLPRPELEKSREKTGYQRPTKTSPIKEETKTEEIEVSSRRGSGKFGVELRRTSLERSTLSSERRRSSTEHYQPCIEDIYDLDLLEQMLEKVVGYEQRRRIRAQIRIAKKKIETGHVFDSNTYTKSIKSSITPIARSPERSNYRPTPTKTASPENQPRDQKTAMLNGHAKEPLKTTTNKLPRPQSPEKPCFAQKTRSPVRHPSPDKNTRNLSPTKVATPKQKTNRFSEYASAYMKKVGLNEKQKEEVKEIKTEELQKTTETRRFSSSSNSLKERTSSKDAIEIVQNGKRSFSPETKPSSNQKVVPEKKASPERTVAPERRASPERKPSPSDRLYYRSPSPDFKRPRAVAETEVIIKTVVEKTPTKPSEDKPSWITNRNLKKTSSETRTFTSKKTETEKKYRATSPSKIISKPLDVITSSYGPGPLDADGRPLFGIKALRNGASNYQVRGTVVREEYHSSNGSAPEGSVSVTAYSTDPEELEKLLRRQGEPVSRLHGLAAITTTKKFGGNTGTSYKEIHTKEERASLDQFTSTDRKMDSKIVDISEQKTKSDQLSRSRIDEHKKESENRRNREREAREDQLSKSRIEQIEARKSKDREDRKAAREEVVSSRLEEQKRDIAERRIKGREERKEMREDRKTVRQSSIKSLTEKYIKNASDTKTRDRGYPKAGLILRTGSSSSNLKEGLANEVGTTRSDSEQNAYSTEGETIIETKSSSQTTSQGLKTSQTSQTRVKTSQGKTERSFLDSTTKVTGVQDILTRMKNADIVIEDGDTTEDTEARALLNKFLGATVLMAGMKSYVVDQQPTVKIKETVRQSTTSSTTTGRSIQEIDLEQCWDERVLKKLLEGSTDYEQRRRIRARIRALMAEQEACATAVTEALAAAEGAVTAEAPGDAAEATDGAREEEEVSTVKSSVRRDSSEKTSSSTTTTTSQVIESMTRPAPKPASPFAKFRQLEKQNSTNSPNSPKSPISPKTPQSPGSAPYFKFTDPALQASAVTIKERLLQWCRDKTRDYENVKLENFSTSWADGLAFCALVHHFLPDAFDYAALTPDKRRHNFTLAFKIADEKAGIYPLLDVDDMVAMRKPDWKCVFTYVQAIHRRFKDQD